MLMLRPRAKDQAADASSERNPQAYGVVRYPKCETKIEIRGWTLAPAEEFSVRCMTCGSRSFHARGAITSPGPGKTSG